MNYQSWLILEIKDIFHYFLLAKERNHKRHTIVNKNSNIFKKNMVFFGDSDNKCKIFLLFLERKLFKMKVFKFFESRIST